MNLKQTKLQEHQLSTWSFNMVELYFTKDEQKAPKEIWLKH
jgi:hypothetical protein